jgi:hypothetical protein
MFLQVVLVCLVATAGVEWSLPVKARMKTTRLGRINYSLGRCSPILIGSKGMEGDPTAG